ncbi:hypothetical protein BofuT4_P113940.1 [Botrytis cinerea T4]|uniref:Uncharacterized protein n=1 Tax=Botryotinia fuckeliana (strain T4) TaxID=999810 RepID=G2Y5F0_BOTF4|nr:hypothetical protein BofuT4_P113940.1 [Botrytis cinerea T4]
MEQSLTQQSVESRTGDGIFRSRKVSLMELLHSMFASFTAILPLVDIGTWRRITVRMMMELWTVNDADPEHISWVLNAAFGYFSCLGINLEAKDEDTGER